MSQKLNQILILSGLYFIISSFLLLISSRFNLLLAIAFPIFLIVIISLTFFKRLDWVTTLTKRSPNIILLLNVLGAYTVVYFIINLLGIILQFVSKQGLLNSTRTIYEEWVEPITAMIDILFFMAFIITLFVILVRNLRK